MAKGGIDICVLPRVFTAKVVRILLQHFLYLFCCAFVPRASISLSPASARMSLKVQWKAYFMHASIYAQLREILIAIAMRVSFVICYTISR